MLYIDNADIKEKNDVIRKLETFLCFKHVIMCNMPQYEEIAMISVNSRQRLSITVYPTLLNQMRKTI